MAALPGTMDSVPMEGMSMTRTRPGDPEAGSMRAFMHRYAVLAAAVALPTLIFVTWMLTSAS